MKSPAYTEELLSTVLTLLSAVGASLDPNDEIKTIIINKKPLIGEDTDAHVRRAISTTYYALFHELAFNCADCLASEKATDIEDRVWVLTYRAISHGGARVACERIANAKESGSYFGLSDGIVATAALFIEAQAMRENADYNPAKTFTVAEARDFLLRTAKTIGAFRRSKPSHKRSLAAMLLFKFRSEK